MSDFDISGGSNYTVALVGEYTERAGTRTYLADLMNHLFENKVGVHLFSSGGHEGDSISALSRSLGFRHTRLSSNVERFSFGTWIRGHSPHEGVEVSAVIADRTSGVSLHSIIVSVGTPGRFIESLAGFKRSFYIMHTYPHGRRSYFFGWQCGRNLPASSIVITVSKYAQQKIAQSWRPRVPVEVVFSSASILPVTRLVQERLRVLTVGSVEKYKNPKLWLKVARRVLRDNPHQDINFVWVGDGSLIGECRAIVDRYHLAENISFVGSVDNVAPFYASADIYLQPSQVESLGLAALDAMCVGIPVVLSDAGGLPELVDNRVSGLICRKNQVGEFVGAINLLVNDPSTRNRFQEAALKRFEERFSRTRWQQGLNKIFFSTTS